MRGEISVRYHHTELVLVPVTPRTTLGEVKSRIHAQEEECRPRGAKRVPPDRMALTREPVINGAYTVRGRIQLDHLPDSTTIGELDPAYDWVQNEWWYVWTKKVVRKPATRKRKNDDAPSSSRSAAGSAAMTRWVLA